jgi:hypothetical protein
MIPAEQRFHADDSAIAYPHDWLVLEPKLLSFDRVGPDQVFPGSGLCKGASAGTGHRSQAPPRYHRVGWTLRLMSAMSPRDLFHLDRKGIGADPETGSDLPSGLVFRVEQAPGLRREIAEFGNSDAPPLPLPLHLCPEILCPHHRAILASVSTPGHWSQPRPPRRCMCLGREQLVESGTSGTDRAGDSIAHYPR